MRLFKVSLTLILTNCVLWSYSQQYLLQNNDSLQNKIVEFFRVKQPEIWEFTKMYEPVDHIPTYLPCSNMKVFEFYKPLKEYDSVFVDQGNLVITFLKKEKTAKLPLSSFLDRNVNIDKCIMYWVPPAGFGFSTNGLFWDNYWIHGWESELKSLFYECNVALEVIKQKEMKQIYWDDFDTKLSNAASSDLNAPITEEQRKLIVMANAASDDRDYKSALAFYDQLIKLNPYGYPDAYYNMALIASNMSNFELAISNMKKYMLLVPNAKDSRTAQDKIYEWEYKLNKN